MIARARVPARGDLGPVSVMAMLGARGPMSRADLARALQVSPASVTQMTKSLLAAGVIAELESVPSRGGRPARLLGLAHSGGGALGAKVAPDHITLVDVSLDGSAHNARTVAFDAAAPDAIDQVVRVLRAAVEEYDGLLLGVGVGIPGTVEDQATGVVQAPIIGWHEVPLGDLLRRALKVPVLIDNDVNTVAVAERLYGSASDFSSPLLVTIGRGVGSGLISDGVLLRGNGGGAGEIGHVPVVEDGPECECGNTGCLEAIIGAAGLVRRARELGVLGPDQGTDDLREAADRGDERARALFAEAGRHLGRALAGVVHVVAPEVVVVLGEGLASWTHWEHGFEQAFRRHLLPSRRALPVIVEPWADDKWAVGAASLVLYSPFDVSGTGGEQGRLVRARLQDGAPVEAAAR